ncbi:hypothetical protein ACWDUL_20490 [Nocardia niigatensis]
MPRNTRTGLVTPLVETSEQPAGHDEGSEPTDWLHDETVFVVDYQQCSSRPMVPGRSGHSEPVLAFDLTYASFNQLPWVLYQVIARTARGHVVQTLPPSHRTLEQVQRQLQTLRTANEVLEHALKHALEHWPDQASDDQRPDIAMISSAA